MNKISVIVPIYKIAEEYLHECMESLLEQTYKNLEFILIDDGSPDNCGEICDSYAGKDERIKVIHQENQGLSNVRNNGIQAASGYWIAFVDPDDWIEKDAFEKAVQIADREQVDMMVWNTYLNPPGREIIRKNYGKDLIVKDPVLLEEINLNFLRTISVKKGEIRIQTLESTTCHLYRRDIIIDNHLLFDNTLKQGEDKLFNYSYHMHIKSFAYLNRPMYHYRLHSESTTHTFFPENVDTSNRILKKYYLMEPKIKENPRYRNTYYMRTAYIAWFLIGKYYLHPQNNLTGERTRLKQFKHMVSEEPYATSIKQMKLTGMRISVTRLRLMLLKAHMYGVLFADVKLERALRSLLKRKS